LPEIREKRGLNVKCRSGGIKTLKTSDEGDVLLTSAEKKNLWEGKIKGHGDPKFLFRSARGKQAANFHFTLCMREKVSEERKKLNSTGGEVVAAFLGRSERFHSIQSGDSIYSNAQRFF